MSGASPASIDYVNRMAFSNAGGQLANQGSDPAAPDSGAYLYAKAGKVWTKRANGSVNLLNGAQNGISAAVTVANSTAETDIASYTVAAGEPAAGSVYQLYLWGAYSATGTTPMLTFSSYYGGIGTANAIASVPAIATAGTEADCLFDLTALLQFYSATKAQGVIRLNLGTSATTDGASTYVSAPAATAGATVSSTAAKTFDISVIWSAKDAGNTLTVLGGYPQRIA
jgi:hypothetical protein